MTAESFKPLASALYLHDGRKEENYLVGHHVLEHNCFLFPNGVFALPAR